MVLTTAPDVPGLTRQLADGAAKDSAGGKPALYVMLPGRVAEPARRMLVERSLPYVDTLAEAVSVLSAWKDWSEYSEPAQAVRPAAGYQFSAPQPGTLDEASAKALVAAAGLPVNRAVIVRDAEQALARSAELGFPLVLKVVSPDIAHKSDVGGVALGIADADDLRVRLERMQTRIAELLPQARIEGFSLQAQEAGELEMIIGAQFDPQFGAQVIVGAGGVLVELFKDVIVLPAPVDAASARAALDRLKIAPLLGAFRGRGALDSAAVVDAIVRLGWLAHDMAQAAPGQDFEIEVNPLKVRLQGQGAVAVDARARIGSA
jgi:acetyl-CoA synthetase (ADP-forming)